MSPRERIIWMAQGLASAARLKLPVLPMVGPFYICSGQLKLAIHLIQLTAESPQMNDQPRSGLLLQKQASHHSSDHH